MAGGRGWAECPHSPGFFVSVVKSPVVLIRMVVTSAVYFVFFQINELSHVQIPVMLMPDDFKAYSKIKVDNHLFNK